MGPAMASAKPRPQRKRKRAGKKTSAPPLYGAVDLGTNNCRLLIAQPSDGSFRVVDSHSQIARLGEGLNETGRLSDAAMNRALEAMSRIRAKLKARRVAHVRCIATEACRRAENGAEFVARVREETGLGFRVIGPGEEARLAMLGCHDLIAEEAENVLVVDIGGGSTELSLVDVSAVSDAGDIHTLARARAIRHWVSLPLGVVTLSEAFAHMRDETAAYEAMRAHAREVLSGWKRRSDVLAAMAAGPSHLIGTSGTVTCLAGVHLGLHRYRRDAVDGAWMTRACAEAAIGRLRELGPAGRARLPTIGPERAGLMLSGCAIIDAAWELYPAERLRVADRGLREGLLLTMMYGPPRSKRRGRRRKASAAGAESETEAASDGR